MGSTEIERSVHMINNLESLVKGETFISRVLYRLGWTDVNACALYFIASHYLCHNKYN